MRQLTSRPAMGQAAAAAAAYGSPCGTWASVTRSAAQVSAETTNTSWHLLLHLHEEILPFDHFAPPCTSSPVCDSHVAPRQPANATNASRKSSSSAIACISACAHAHHQHSPAAAVPGHPRQCLAHTRGRSSCLRAPHLLPPAAAPPPLLLYAHLAAACTLSRSSLVPRIPPQADQGGNALVLRACRHAPGAARVCRGAEAGEALPWSHPEPQRHTVGGRCDALTQLH